MTYRKLLIYLLVKFSAFTFHGPRYSLISIPEPISFSLSVYMRRLSVPTQVAKVVASPLPIFLLFISQLLARKAMQINTQSSHLKPQFTKCSPPLLTTMDPKIDPLLSAIFIPHMIKANPAPCP
jgi:hypothetical protein